MRKNRYIFTPYNLIIICCAVYNQPPTTELDEALIPASTKQWNYNVTVDVTQMVKRMVANPSKNYGFKMRLVTEDTYRSMVFASSEYSDSTKRPKLTVRYKQP